MSTNDSGFKRNTSTDFNATFAGEPPESSWGNDGGKINTVQVKTNQAPWTDPKGVGTALKQTIWPGNSYPVKFSFVDSGGSPSAGTLTKGGTYQLSGWYKRGGGLVDQNSGIFQRSMFGMSWGGRKATIWGAAGSTDTGCLTFFCVQQKSNPFTSSSSYSGLGGLIARKKDGEGNIWEKRSAIFTLPNDNAGITDYKTDLNWLQWDVGKFQPEIQPYTGAWQTQTYGGLKVAEWQSESALNELPVVSIEASQHTTEGGSPGWFTIKLENRAGQPLPTPHPPIWVRYGLTDGDLSPVGQPGTAQSQEYIDLTKELSLTAYPQLDYYSSKYLDGPLDPAHQPQNLIYINPLESEGRIYITALEDAIAEGTETVNLSLLINDTYDSYDPDAKSYTTNQSIQQYTLKGQDPFAGKYSSPETSDTLYIHDKTWPTKNIFTQKFNPSNLYDGYEYFNTDKLSNPNSDGVSTEGPKLAGWGTAAHSADMSADASTEKSPAGGIPLKMVSTGIDPYSNADYSGPQFNIGLAEKGETWTASVYAKADKTTGGQIFLFENGGTSDDFSIHDQSIQLTPEWQRYSITLENIAKDTQLQFRVDGPDGNPYEIDTQPENGSATIDAVTGAWSYTPNASFTGTDAFIVTAKDDLRNLTQQIINLTIGTGDPAAIISGQLSGSGKKNQIISGTINASRSSEDYSNYGFSIDEQDQPQMGSARINSSSGTWSYTPNQDYIGSDAFTVTITDEDSGKPTDQRINLSIGTDNEPSQWKGDLSGKGAANTKISGTLSATDSDGITVASDTTTVWWDGIQVEKGSKPTKYEGYRSINPYAPGITISPYKRTGISSIRTRKNSQGVKSAKFDVYLNSEPTHETTINLTTTAYIGSEAFKVTDTDGSDSVILKNNSSGKSAPAPVLDLAKLTYNQDNWNQPQTITLTNEGDLRVLVTATATSDDPNYQDNKGSREFTQLIVPSNDESALIVNLKEGGTQTSIPPQAFVSAINGQEGQNIGFKFSISQPQSNAIIINYTLTLGDGFNQQDLVGAESSTATDQQQSITIPAGKTSYIHKINTKDDAFAEGTESITATLDPSTKTDPITYTIGDKQKIATSKLKDNDKAGIEFVVPYEINSSEEDSSQNNDAADQSDSIVWAPINQINIESRLSSSNSKQVGIRLKTEIKDNITLSLKDVDLNGITIQPLNNDQSQLVFTQDNWNDPNKHQIIIEVAATNGADQQQTTNDTQLIKYISAGEDISYQNLSAKLAISTIPDEPCDATETPKTEQQDSSLPFAVLANSTGKNEITLAETSIDRPDGRNYAITSQGENGKATINSTTGAWTYTPNSKYTGMDSFIVTSNNNNGEISKQMINISVGSNANSPTNITGDRSGSGFANQQLRGTLSASDTEGLTKPNPFRITTQADHGTAVIDPGTGQWTYTPNLNYKGYDFFTVSVTDDIGSITKQIINIEVGTSNNVTHFTGDLTGVVKMNNVEQLFDLRAEGTLKASNALPTSATFAITLRDPESDEPSIADEDKVIYFNPQQLDTDGVAWPISYDINVEESLKGLQKHITSTTSSGSGSDQTTEGVDLEGITTTDLQSNQTVSWKGFLYIPESGEYKFDITRSGGAKLSINNQTLIDELETSKSTDVATTSTVYEGVAGEFVPIQLEYKTSNLEPSLNFKWNRPNQQNTSRKIEAVPLKYLSRVGGWHALIKKGTSSTNITLNSKEDAIAEPDQIAKLTLLRDHSERINVTALGGSGNTNNNYIFELDESSDRESLTLQASDLTSLSIGESNQKDAFGELSATSQTPVTIYQDYPVSINATLKPSNQNQDTIATGTYEASIAPDYQTIDNAIKVNLENPANIKPGEKINITLENINKQDSTYTGTFKRNDSFNQTVILPKGQTLTFTPPESLNKEPFTITLQQCMSIAGNSTGQLANCPNVISSNSNTPKTDNDQTSSNSPLNAITFTSKEIESTLYSDSVQINLTNLEETLDSQYMVNLERVGNYVGDITLIAGEAFTFTSEVDESKTITLELLQNLTLKADSKSTSVVLKKRPTGPKSNQALHAIVSETSKSKLTTYLNPYLDSRLEREQQFQLDASLNSYKIDLLPGQTNHRNAELLPGTKLNFNLTPDNDNDAPPIFQSAEVNASGNKVILTYDKPLSATTATAPQFTITSNNEANEVTAVAVAGATVELELTEDVTNGELITVAYTKPSGIDAANAIQDSNNKKAISLSSISFTAGTCFTEAQSINQGFSLLLPEAVPLTSETLKQDITVVDASYNPNTFANLIASEDLTTNLAESYAELSGQDYYITVQNDNQTAGIQFSKRKDNDYLETDASEVISLKENGQGERRFVQLSSQPTEAVTVYLESDDPSEVKLEKGYEFFKQSAATPSSDDIVDSEIKPARTSNADFLQAAIDLLDSKKRIKGFVVNYRNPQTRDTIRRIDFVKDVDTIMNDASKTDGLDFYTTEDKTSTLKQTFSNSLQEEEFSANSLIALTFSPTNWNIPQPFTVIPVDDFIDDDTQNANIYHRIISNDSEYQAITPYQVDGNNKLVLSVENLNDDSADVTIELQNDPISEAESGYLDFTLSSQPNADVTLTLSPSDSQFTLNNKGLDQSDTITFTPEDWNTIKTIKLKAEDDDIVEDITTSKLTIKSTSDDAKFDTALKIKPISIDIVDNDLPTASIIPVDDAQEGSEPGRFRIELSNAAPISKGSQGIVVQYQIKDANGANLVSPELNGVGKVRIAPGQTTSDVFVIPIDDPAAPDPDSGDKSFSIELIEPSSTAGYKVVKDAVQNSASLKIIDDDEAGFYILHPGDNVSLVEGETNNYIQVGLLSKPTNDVTINISEDKLPFFAGSKEPIQQLSGPAKTVTFTSDEWWDIKTIPLTAYDDDIIEDGYYDNASLNLVRYNPSGDAIDVAGNIVGQEDPKLQHNGVHPAFLRFTFKSEDTNYSAKLNDAGHFTNSTKLITIIDRALPDGASDNIHTALNTIQSSINEYQLPMLGKSDLKIGSKFYEFIDEVTGKTGNIKNLTTAKVQKLIADELMDLGINSPNSPVTVKMDNQDINLNFKFSLDNKDDKNYIPLDSNFGVPALNFKSQGDLSLSYNVDGELDLYFPTNGNSPYVKTAVSTSVSNVDVQSDLLTLEDSINFETGDRVTLATTGTLPGGLQEKTVYFVLKNENSDNTIQLKNKNDDQAAIDLTSIGSGDITITNPESSITATLQSQLSCDDGDNSCQDFKVTGGLGFLQLDATNAKAPTIEGKERIKNSPSTEMGVTLQASLQNNASNAAANNKLTISDIKKQGISDVVNYSILNYRNGDTILPPSAVMSFDVNTSVGGNSAFPSFQFDIAAELPFTQGQDKTLFIDNVKLDLGSFVTQLADPIVSQVDTILSPVYPVIDALYSDTHIFKKLGLTSVFDQGNDGQVSVMDLVQWFSNLSGANPSRTKKFKAAEKFITNLKDLSDLIRDIDQMTDAGNVYIDYPSTQYTFGSQPISAKQTNVPKSLKDQSQTNDKSKSPKSLIKRMYDLGFTFPLIDDSSTLSKLITGEDTDILQWVVSTSNPKTDEDNTFNVEASVSKSFPMGPISGVIEGGVNTQADLSFGFDTRGIKAWREDDFNLDNAWKVFNGFYVNDRHDGVDIPEFQLNADMGAGAGLNAFIARADVTGGIEAKASLDLIDVGEIAGIDDGKVYADEIIERIDNPISLFEMVGDLAAYLRAKVQVGIDLYFYSYYKTVWEKNLARIPIFKFGVGGSFASGTASNGYLEGSKVFFDANFDGWHNGLEPSITTGKSADYHLEIDSRTFDLNRNGIIDPNEGRLMAYGGVDQTTGLTLEVPFIAPAGEMITPLTTIHSLALDLGYPEETADHRIRTLFNLGNFDYLHNDPLAHLKSKKSIATDKNQDQLSTYLAHSKIHFNLDLLFNILSQTNDQYKQTNQHKLKIMKTFTKFLLKHPSNVTADTATRVAMIDAIQHLHQDSPIDLQKTMAHAASFIVKAGTEMNAKYDSLLQKETISLKDIHQIKKETFENYRESVEKVTHELHAIAGNNSKIKEFKDRLDAINGTHIQFTKDDIVQLGHKKSEQLMGGPGKDLLAGADGDDSLHGKSGVDYIKGGNHDDIIKGGLHNDILKGQAGQDIVNGGQGNDELYGGSNIDTLKGMAGNDHIYAGKDNDILDGGAGDDILSGGQGKDQFVLSKGKDKITDFHLKKGNGDQVIIDSSLNLNYIQRGDNLIIKDGDDIRTTLIDVDKDKFLKFNPQL